MACWLEVDMMCVKIRNCWYIDKMRNIYKLVDEREAILATLLGELEFHVLISSSSYD